MAKTRVKATNKSVIPPRPPIRLTSERDRKSIAYRLTIGENDRHYDLRLHIGPDVAEIEQAADGVLRPGCVMLLGGLDEDENASEITLFRCFGEDECRWIAKAFLRVAGDLRRIEDKRRRAAKKPKPRP